MSSGEGTQIPKNEDGSTFEAKLLLTSSSSRRDGDKILSDTDTDSESEYVCKVCDKKFSGYKPLLQHQKGTKHAKALLRKKNAKRLMDKIAAAEEGIEEEEGLLPTPFSVCKVCKKEFSSPESYLSHLVSKAHKQKVRQASIVDRARVGGEIDPERLRELHKQKDRPEDPEPEGLECHDCERTFSGIIPYAQHIVSKVHARTVDKKKLMGTLIPEGGQQSHAAGQSDAGFAAVEDGIIVCRLCSASFSGPQDVTLHLKSRGHKKNLDRLVHKQQRKQARAKSVTEDVTDASRKDEASSANSENETDSGSDGEDSSDESTGVTRALDATAVTGATVGSSSDCPTVRVQPSYESSV